MAHLYRTLVSMRNLILAGTLTLAAVGGFAAVGLDRPPTHAASAASCAGGSVTTVPFTYLVKHLTIGSAGCATAAAQVYAATLPQTNFLHYLPYTARLQEVGASPTTPAVAAVPAASLVPAVHAASCAGGSVTTLPETYLITHWGTTSDACATAAAQVYAATLPQTNFLHYLPYTARLQQGG